MKRSVALVIVSLLSAGCGATTTRTVTVHDHGTPEKVVITRTVSEPAVTVTTQAAAVPVSAPAPKAAAPRGRHFAGNGGETLPDFTLSGDRTLTWTNDGGIFAIYDSGNEYDSVPVNSQAHRGSTQLTAGRYSGVQVNAVGNWTITIK